MDNKKKHKINWKSFGTITIIIILILSIVGIVFLSNSFNKNSENKQSKDFGNQLSLTYSVLVDKNPDNPNNANQKSAKEISDSFYDIVKSNNISEFKIDYSSAQSDIAKVIDSNLTQKIDYINLYLTTNINDPFFGFDPELAWSKVVKPDKDGVPANFNYVSSLQQQLGLFAKLTNNYNLRYVSTNLQQTANQNLFPNNFNIRLANKDSEITGTTNINISLPKSYLTITPTKKDAKGNYWDLKSFQTEFLTNFASQWDELKDKVPTNQEVVDKFKEANAESPESKLTSPKQVDLLWINRSKLIFDVQLAYLAVFLSDKYTSNAFPETVTFSQRKIAENLIKTISPYQKDIGYWLLKHDFDGQHIKQLSDSLSYKNTNGVDWRQDPLIQMLKTYYELADPSVPSTDPDYTNIQSYKTANLPQINSSSAIPKFLYSWNLQNNSLLKSYLSSVDYYNFFNYFPNSTPDFYPNNLQEKPAETDEATFNNDIKKWIKDNNAYYSKEFSIPVDNLYNAGYGKKDLPELLKNTNIDNNFFNLNILESSILRTKSNNQTEVPKLINHLLGLTQSFLNQFTIIKTDKANSFIGLPNYLSTFLGIVVLILIVGIVVSVLYRIPGLISSVLSMFSFVASSSFFITLGTPFSFSTFLSLSVFSLLSFIPNIMLFDYFKTGIRKNLNTYNSLLYSFKRYLKLSIGYHITAIIIGIAFLFFGKFELVSFGSILVVSSFTSLLLNSILYFLIFWLFLYCAETKMNLFLNKKYLVMLEELNKTTFQDSSLSIIEPILISNKLTQSFSRLSFFGNFKKNALLITFVIFTIVAIVGAVLLAVIGFGFSDDFKTTSTIMISVSNINNVSLNNTQIDSIVKYFGGSIEKLTVNHTDISTDYFITFKTNLLDSNFQSLILLNDANNPNNITPFRKLLESLGLYGKEGFVNQLDISKNFQLIYNNPLPALNLRKALVTCLFIAIAFVLIWSLIWLGFTNMVMYFIILMFNILIIVGIVGITRMDFNTDSMMSISQSFLFFALINFVLFTDYKQQIKLNENNGIEVYQQQIVNQNERVITIYFISSLAFVTMDLISIGVLNSNYVFPMLLSALSSLVIAFTNFVLINNLFYVAVLFRRLFAKYKSEKIVQKYLANNKHPNRRMPKDFDKIDEQEIIGINKFR